LGALVVGYLAGPEHDVQAILSKAAPIVGWLVLSNLVLGALWLFYELAVPLWICILAAVWSVVEYGAQSVSDAITSAAAGCVETLGWIFLGFEGFLFGTLLVGGLSALAFWIVFVPSRKQE
jgi:hypothetical protein